jgi:hypothetical protein
MYSSEGRKILVETERWRKEKGNKDRVEDGKTGRKKE